MFQNLTERLASAVKTLRGQSQFTEENTHALLRDVRVSLLEADVALPVIKNFLETIKEKILGEKVHAALKPDQALLKIIKDELIHLMGDNASELNLKAEPPVIILLAGLQGSGKTTSAAKLAKYLQE